MVEGARVEATRIRAEVEAERARVLAGAIEEGRREGLARAGAILAAATAEGDRRLAATESEAVSLALAIARKVIGRELSDPSRAAVVDLAAHALREARELHCVALLVSPIDASAVRAAEGRLGGLLARGVLSIREDASLSAGNVVLETESGRIDARVETQLAALARALEAVAP